VREKKDKEVGDPFKILLKETLKRQRNEMIDNFRDPSAGETSSSSSHFEGIVPYNFDIPIFEGQIDVDALDR